MSLLRHLVRQETMFKKGLKAKRFKAALDTGYTGKVLRLFFEHLQSCHEVFLVNK